MHPTTIGYGIVAEAFLEAMNGAGIAEVPWEEVMQADTLLTSPSKTQERRASAIGGPQPIVGLDRKSADRAGAA